MQVWTSWMHVCSDIRVALFAVDFRVTFTTTGSVSSRTLTQNLVSAPDSRTAGTATRYCLQTQRYTHTAVTSMDVRKKKSQIRIHVHQLQISQDIKNESIIEANLRSRSCLTHMCPADKGAQRPCPTQNPRLTHNWLWCSSESASVKYLPMQRPSPASATPQTAHTFVPRPIWVPGKWKVNDLQISYWLTFASNFQWFK